MTTVSEFIIPRIKQWGVIRVFGYPGVGVGQSDPTLGQTDREGTGLE